MNFDRFRKKRCQACGLNKLPKEPAIINLDGHQFLVCEECERFMGVFEAKFNEVMGEKHKTPIDIMEEEYEQSV